jgi:hypothetical protein
MEIDASRFPLVAQYVKSLPQGLASYPDCKVRATVYEDLKKDFPQLDKMPDLPEVLRQALADSSKKDWLPEVVGNALCILVRDSILQTDETFYAWYQKNMVRLYRKPLFRAMMLIFSPTLVVIGAAKRWTTFHIGSTLSAEPVQELDGRNQTGVTFSFPPHSFDLLLLRRLNISFRVALDGTRAKEPKVEMDATGPASAHYVASWR